MDINPAFLPAGRNVRRGRYPRHSFNLKVSPFQIVPFLIAPVLPGDTLKNAVLQARAVSDPITNDLAGAWLGFDLFYVKLRDLAGREDFMGMMVDLNKDMSAYQQASARSAPMYTALGGMKWVQYCLDSVVGAYYRDEADAPADIGSYPAAMLNVDDWMQSLTQDTDMVSPDFNIDTDSSTTIEASEVEAALLQWQILRSNNLIDMTYEDYLAGQGISLPDPEDERPELLRTVRSWTYPANATVGDGSGGSVLRSVWSWSVAERVDKARFFKEPGFVFGTTTVKAKVYKSLVSGAGAAHMNDLLSWLPKQVSMDVRARMKKFAAGTGPLPSNTDDYWFDVADLLSYGDQFFNWAIDEAEFAMPVAGGEFKYPTEAMMQTLFSGASYDIRMDGVVQFNIASSIKDVTPRGSSSVTV